VTIGYGASNGNPRGEVGAVGVLGPTRMDYASSMAAVNAVARYIGRFMDEAN
jgi:transcriptional regulator of heat shock response